VRKGWVSVSGPTGRCREVSAHSQLQQAAPECQFRSGAALVRLFLRSADDLIKTAASTRVDTHLASSRCKFSLLTTVILRRRNLT
jgi:hypothetical protein